MDDKASDAAPEQQHARDENDPLDVGDPGAKLCQVMLHRGQEKRPDDRAENGAQSSDNVILREPAKRWAGGRDKFGIEQVKRLLIVSALPVLMGACGLAVDRDCRCV